MVLVESKPEIYTNPKPLEWVLPRINEDGTQDGDNKTLETSLFFVSEGCSKYRRKKIFKEAYQKLMEKNPVATYQEKLSISSKFISGLREQNPNIPASILKSMKRSFAAQTGSQIGKLKKEIKNSESIVTLANGKEIHYTHPWSFAVNQSSDQSKAEKENEKKVLVKIIDFRSKLKSLIDPRETESPDEILKICETHIAGLIRSSKDLNPDTFLSEVRINSLINPERRVTSYFMSPVASNYEEHTLKSWVETVKKNNTSSRFSFK